MRYVLVDRILDLIPGQFLKGVKCVSVSDGLVTRYAAGLSVLPSTMLLESMAQAAGALAAASIDFRAQPVLAKVQPFAVYGHATPGDRITVRAELEDLREEACRTRSEAWIDSSLLAEAIIFLALVPFDRGREAQQSGQLRARLADTFPGWFSAPADREVES